MILKILLILLLLIAIISLFMALRTMLRTDKQARVDMVRALSWRMGVCFFAFFLLLLAYYLGWIQPHGLPIVRG